MWARAQSKEQMTNTSSLYSAPHHREHSVTRWTELWAWRHEIAVYLVGFGVTTRDPEWVTDNVTSCYHGYQLSNQIDWSALGGPLPKHPLLLLTNSPALPMTTRSCKDDVTLFEVLLSWYVAQCQGEHNEMVIGVRPCHQLTRRSFPSSTYHRVVSA